MDPDAREHHYMQDAIRLGRTALARSSPNPAVGAIIVDAGGIAGRGWTQPPGGPHAEVVALNEAGARSRGATLYVTLEPCCHVGRTPPCVDAIIDAGIRRCVVALDDPFPAVAGEGIARLRAAGVTVDVGRGAPDAEELHAGYLTRVQSRRPLVRAKYAMTLDGHIATRTGDSRWITGEAARQHAHAMRDRADAVMVGAGTVRTDDPALTTRLPDELVGYGGAHHALRVIVDGRGTAPLQSRVFDTGLPGRTLVVITERAHPAWRSELAGRGIETLVCGAGPRVDLAAMLDALSRRGLNEVLVEGGGRMLGALFDTGLVDRVAAFVAPVITGGARAPGPVAGYGCAALPSAWRLADVRLTVLGDDMLLEGAVTPRATEGA